MNNMGDPLILFLFLLLFFECNGVDPCIHIACLMSDEFSSVAEAQTCSPMEYTLTLALRLHALPGAIGQTGPL